MKQAMKQEKGISRRDFIKQSAAVAAATAVMGASGGVALAGRKPSTPRWGMVIDLRKCFGCHACAIACKTEFDVPLGYWKSWVRYTERGTFPNVQRFFLPLLCNQCENPPCVDVCPTGATYKRKDGIVAQSEKDCIGCKACVQGCPYGARYSDPKKKVAQKCDFCVHRLEQGKLPSCVNTCNARARIVGDLNDPNSEISKVIAKNKVQALRTELGTDPRVFYIGLDRYAYEPVKVGVGYRYHEKGGRSS